jgi:hypothetical protein
MHDELLEQLLAAVRHDNVERIAELLAQGAPVNGRTERSGLTPLHVAVEHFSHEALRRLIVSGAALEEEAQGMTPLALAVDSMIDAVCQNGGQPDQTAIDLLLAAGANPRSGSTSAVDVVREYGVESNAALLARLQAHDPIGR